MANDWGLKVTKVGAETTSTDPRDMLFNSSYQMFKYSGDYSTSGTLTPGDKTFTVSVAHNLGYVPAFIAYVYRGDTSRLEIIPDYPYGVGYDTSIEAYANTASVYFKVTTGLISGAGWNQTILNDSDIWSTLFGGFPRCVVGDVSGAESGAVRFTNVPVSSGSSLQSANLEIYSNDNGTVPDSSRIKWDVYGIDEDNTSALSSSDPFSRSRTSATQYRNISVGEADPGKTVGMTVTSMVNEIKARGGWSSGNAMGFTLINNGSDSNSYFSQTNSGDAKLTLTFSGNAVFDFRTIVFKDKIHS